MKNQTIKQLFLTYHVYLVIFFEDIKKQHILGTLYFFLAGASQKHQFSLSRPFGRGKVAEWIYLESVKFS